MFGFLNIDKPLGMTSHDVVDRARRKLGVKRVGHAGTLDPLASGVLILCVGVATRLSEYVMDSTKRYRARVRLGEVTPSYDRESEVIRRQDASHISRAAVERALQAFLGEIEQVPPMYSAIKQDGMKLYDLARAGETVERVARKVRIDALTITAWEPPEFSLEVTCSAGTYIRSLAFDIGEALGVGAHLAGLARLASGQFTLETATPLQTFAHDERKTHLIPPRAELLGMVPLTLDEEKEIDVKHGRMLPLDGTYASDTLALASNAAGETVGVLRVVGGLWKPEKVFSG